MSRRRPRAGRRGLGGKNLAAATAEVPGRRSVINPHRLAANSVMAVAIAAKNQGCWNWMPQPTATPACLSAASTRAMARKETMIPAAVASSCRRTPRRSAPANPASSRSFSESTGSTQGMTFRINPPTSAMPRRGRIVGLGAKLGGVPRSGVAVNSAARAPSTTVNVSARPVTA